METIGQIVGLCVVAFVIYWAGFFTCAVMTAGKREDERAEQIHEQLRKVEP